MSGTTPPINGVPIPARPVPLYGPPRPAPGRPDDPEDWTPPALPPAWQAPPPFEDEPLEGRVLVDQPHTEPDDDLLGTLAARRTGRRPVVPPWAQSRADVLQVARWQAEHAAYVATFHALRTPLYAARVLGRTPAGARAALAGALRWVFDTEAGSLRKQAIATGQTGEYLTLTRQHAERVKRRGIMAAAAVVVAVPAGLLLTTAAPWWITWAALFAVLGALAKLGTRPDTAPVFDRAVIPARVEKLTSDIVIRGLAATGISELKKGTGIDFKAPIMRDGPGWRAEVDLPYGVTADAVIDKRKELATGLRRPMGCVWPEPVPEEHPGRLVLWVGDVELRKSRRPAWPLAKAGRVDLFDAVDYGVDVRGRWVQVTLMYASVVIGSIPRMGKTFLLRLLLLIAALDPRAELHAYDLKGTGDLSPAEPVAHRYRAGEEDDDIEYAVASMRELKAELRRRAKVIRELPKDVCPESKVTSKLASMKHLRLHPIVIAVDECQVWFEHPKHGAELEAICTDIVKRGPALGMVPLFATQRPDAKSLPTGISANAVLRFGLKVIGHTENDMVLGSGMNKAGYKAQTFSRKDLGIHYLAGEGDDPRIVRGVYVDAPAAEQIVARARVMREEAGTLSGYALGHEPAAGAARDLLADIIAVTPAAEKRVWNSVTVDRLAERWPDAYGQWAGLPDEQKTATLTGLLKPFGIVTEDTHGRTADGKTANRKGFRRDDVVEAHRGRGKGKSST